ncbi:Uncharacterised protein [Legionella busanensis]|uniref:Uncharacterized protein n=1 Tax=Legionella busanensis TaxID=190655 RepID=A0A378JIV9_9GAMM|nr:hypothetical protein [Legionella busanensis]STX51135.1 Uncharacterised protein [Legionella busanensis]
MKKKFETKLRNTFNGLFSSSNQSIDTKGKTPGSSSDEKRKRPDSNDKIDSITKAQALTRGFLARKNYGIQQLSQKELQLYPILIKGNDPELSKEQEKELPRHIKKEKIALIGTSGMRSVELACQLSEGAPKLIVLDNSVQVTLFWRKVKEIIHHVKNEKEFLNELEAYISKDCKELDLSLYPFGNRFSKKLNNPNHTLKEFNYLEKLFKSYGFEQIKAIISNMSIIKQSWSEKDILVKIKNILARHDITTIYAYPSNIVAYMNDDIEEAEKILENIKKLNPEIAIHTDSVYFSGEGNRPENLYLVPKNKHNPSDVRKVLKIENILECQSLKSEFLNG